MDGREDGRTDADFIAELARRRGGGRLMPMCQNIAKSVRPIYGEGERASEEESERP